MDDESKSGFRNGDIPDLPEGYRERAHKEVDVVIAHAEKALDICMEFGCPQMNLYGEKVYVHICTMEHAQEHYKIKRP